MTDHNNSATGKASLLFPPPCPADAREPMLPVGFTDLEPSGGEGCHISSRDAKGTFPKGGRDSEPDAVPFLDPWRDGGAARVAVHEAGHAVAGRLLGFPVGLATINPTSHFAGA